MDIEKEINDVLAPLTRAYSNLRIEKILVAASDIKETEATFTVVFRADRKAHDTLEFLTLPRAEDFGLGYPVYRLDIERKE